MDSHSQEIFESSVQSQLESVNEPRYWLDPWGEDQRRIPSDLVRSALFNVRNKTAKRQYLEQTPIPCQAGTTITYTGPDLRQIDSLVWMQALHLAKSKPLGEAVEFTAYEFCTAIGWSIGGSSYERLRACLLRLQSAHLQIYSKSLRLGVSLPLIDDFAWKDELGYPMSHYMLTLPKALVSLFGKNNYTQIEWEMRLKLANGLPSWCLDYFSSHRQPFELSLEYIRKLCGSTGENQIVFKRRLQDALMDLKEVGFLNHFKIDNNKVSVERRFKNFNPLPNDLAHQLGKLPLLS